MSKLEVVEGAQQQSADEEIIYALTTTNWGSTPSSVSVKAFQEPANTDVTTTVFPTNTPTVSGDIITLSPLKALTKGKTYRIEIKFTSGSNIFEAYFRVSCEV